MSFLLVQKLDVARREDLCKVSVVYVDANMWKTLDFWLRIGPSKLKFGYFGRVGDYLASRAVVP